jgi:hypothetical protein
LGLLGALAAALLLVPAVAQATIVYVHDGNIWAMNDNGSGQHQVVSVLQTPGMDQGLAAPNVDPNGGKVVAFEGTTHANSDFFNDTCYVAGFFESCPITHYGFNSTGIYTWNAGVVQRLSGAPKLCAVPDGCTTMDINPEPTNSGALYFNLNTYSGRLSQGDFVAGSRIYKMTFAGGGRTDYGSPCNDSFLDVGAPNWKNESELVYNCGDAGSQGHLVVSSGGTGGGRDVGDAALSFGSFDAPAFSPDGTLIVAFDNSFQTDPSVVNDTGLYLFSPTGSGAPIRKLMTSPEDDSSGSPEETHIDTPHFIGSSSIVFGLGGNIWTIPASCNNCSFPADAHQLTSDGKDSDPAWTSATLTAPSPKRCVVPKLTGDTVGQARTVLSHANCSLGAQHKAYSRHVRRGHIISQGKRPGSVLGAGSAVSVTVSRGKKPRRHH